MTKKLIQIGSYDDETDIGSQFESVLWVRSRIVEELFYWRHTDPYFKKDELQNGLPPAMVEDI